MSDPVELVLSRFFPSNLRPCFDEGASVWSSIALGFNDALEACVAQWQPDGYLNHPIWIHRELRAVLSHDRDSGYLELSIHPTSAHLQSQVKFILWRCSDPS